ncbi:hypothetical protein LMF97_24280, partial [Salmonella enterica subsp. enterica serovar Typhimurium]|nr:hypothetical protein [Salmonella enterica subsp. enterica serovar Typhimurium]
PAFGVGGDYSQGCSWQLKKINGWKEMRADVLMNLQSRAYLLHFPLLVLLWCCKTIRAAVKSW